MTETKKQSEYILSAEICERLDIHLASLGNWIQEGWFPPPIRLGASGRHRRWRRDTVEKFLAGLEENTRG